MKNRRTLVLHCLPALGALAPVAAGAFRLEAPAAAIAADYAASCGEQQAHAALQAAMASQVDGRPVPPALAALARCPFCGCGVVGAADHGEAPAPRG